MHSSSGLQASLPKLKSTVSETKASRCSELSVKNNQSERLFFPPVLHIFSVLPAPPSHGPQDEESSPWTNFLAPQQQCREQQTSSNSFLKLGAAFAGIPKSSKFIYFVLLGLFNAGRSVCVTIRWDLQVPVRGCGGACLSAPGSLSCSRKFSLLQRGLRGLG